MASRRKETSLPKERPVKFYKIVALTFLFITVVLLGSILFMSSKRATITVVSKENPVDTTTAVEVTQNKNPENSNSIIEGVVTSTRVSVSSTFKPTGEKEIPSQATGKITIHNDSGTPQPLVATTRFLSSDDILFRLENRVDVPANSTITADVYADKKGKQGNIGPDEFTIPGLNPARQEVVYGISNKQMTGGVKSIGILSEKDIEKASDKLKEKIKQKISDNLLSSVDKNKGKLVKIVDTDVDSNKEVGKEVSEFSLIMDAKVVSVAYNKEKIKKVANRELMKRAVDDTETIESSEEDPSVTFDSYDEEDNSVILSIFANGKASLNPESKQLEKIMFFGKSEEEVRRYLLSLDHVHSVDVEFSPAWINDVPHVADHVNIVVKKIN